MTKETLGQIIKRRRKELFPDMNAKTFAEAMHVSPGYLSGVENKGMIPLSEDVIKAFARKLGLNNDYLLASAGKVSAEILGIILDDPIFYTNILRELNKERAVKR